MGYDWSKITAYVGILVFTALCWAGIIKGACALYRIILG